MLQRRGKRRASVLRPLLCYALWVPDGSEAEAEWIGNPADALTALAVEGRLGSSVLLRLATAAELESWRESGCIAPAGETRPLSVAQSGPREPAFSLSSVHRQRVLRAAQALGRLGPLTLQLEEWLGHHSQAPLIRKLQSGSLIFRTATAHRTPLATQRELLASLEDALDPDWMQRTYGDRLPATVAVALDFAWARALPVGRLLSWAANHDWDPPPPGLTSALVSHALVRQEWDWAQRCLHNAPTGSTQGLHSALTCLRSGASETSDAQLSAWGEPSHWDPLLLARSVHSKEDDAAVLARLRELKQSAHPASWKSAARLLELLRKDREPSAADLRRLDPHRLEADAPVWERLLLSLWALHESGSSSRRAAFSARLFEWSDAWQEAGYPWFARQAQLLAHAFDETEAKLPQSRSDLLSLVPLRAPWEHTLDSVEAWRQGSGRPNHSTRLRFFVDLAARRLGKPGRECLRADGGWDLVERLSWEDACKLRDLLPAEDHPALEAWEQSLEQAAEMRPEQREGAVFAALAGHPRVVDPSQGGVDVEIHQRSCAISSEWRGQELCVFWDPLQVEPGWNLFGSGSTRLDVVFHRPEDESLAARLRLPLLVPADGVERALDVLGRLSDQVLLRGPLRAPRRRKAADATPCLRFSPSSGAWLLELGVQPFGPGGRFFPAAEGPAVLNTSAGGRPACTVRDFEEEQRNAAALVQGTKTLRRSEADAPHRWLLSTESALELLAELKESALPVHCDWAQGESLRLGNRLSSGALQASLRAVRGWYLLSGKVPLDEVHDLRLAELARAPMLARGRFVRLPDGSYAELDARLRRVVSALGVSPLHRGELRLRAAQLPGVAAALDPSSLDFDDASRGEMERWQTTHPAENAPLEELLRPYQRKGRDWLRQLTARGFGACLADDMGLGKTVQILACLLSFGPDAHHLVVAPTSVCENWVREATRFAPELAPRHHRSSRDCEEPGLVVLSYGRLVVEVDNLAEQSFDCLVLDEAQLIKNPKTQRARALLSLHAKARIAATGTPIENHLGDLWGLFRFLNPELLGSWRSFSTHFMGPIEREKDAAVGEQLRALVQPFFLRRTKEDVLVELPPVTRIRRTVTLGEDEALRYASLRRAISDKLRTRAGKMNHKLEVLAEITRLRRFCCHPRLVFPEAPDDSAKLRALVPLLRELVESGRQALVFSQYVDFLEQVERRLNEEGIAYDSLDGSTPQAARQEKVDRFMSGACPVFLMSLKAGGLGLNLTAAEVVIHLDPWWNPAVGAQATDRAHRMGQERPVTSIEFVTEGTIEEDILRLHEDKRRLAGSVLRAVDGPTEPADAELLLRLEESLRSFGHEAGCSASEPGPS